MDDELFAICDSPHPADDSLRCGRPPHPDQPDGPHWTATNTPVLWFDEEDEEP